MTNQCLFKVFKSSRFQKSNGTLLRNEEHATTATKIRSVELTDGSETVQKEAARGSSKARILSSIPPRQLLVLLLFLEHSSECCVVEVVNVF